MKLGLKAALTALVIVHLLVSLWHGDAHGTLQIALSNLQNAFVYSVIVIAPLVGAALLAVGAAIVYYLQWGQLAPFPEGLIQANGRIEGDHVTIASKFAGRVAKLHVYEGDDVAANSIVVRIDDKQVRAQVEQAKEAVAKDAKISSLFEELRAQTTKASQLQTLCANQKAQLERFAQQLNEQEIDDLIAFLGALTDPSARDLTHLIPEVVPSGLVVDR